MLSEQSSMKSLITKVIQYARSKISNESHFELFSRFVRFFYSHASVADLKHRTIEELYGMVFSNWELACRKPLANRRRIHVFNPDDKREGWHSSHTVVELITKDMPFVVDSMRMEMNRLGLTVHFTIHMGGMKINRNASGAVTDISSYRPDEDTRHLIESPVYMEIDYQANPIALEQIEENLERVLHDVQITVEDWPLMQARVQEVISELTLENPSLPKDEIQESIAFLKWLLDDQFTFLGARDYEVIGQGETLALRMIAGSGLGVLRDESHSKVTRLFTEIPESARDLMLSTKQLLVISKTNSLSTVHRLVYTDYIGIKRFNQKGELIGERRVIGLYTSTAYSSHPERIPFLRRKVAAVLKKSNFPPKSHAGKDLMHILETFPRDDLFQANVDELCNTAVGILNLQERHKISLFVRKDAYHRYVSCLIYVPRDNFNSQLIVRIQDLLIKTFQGLGSNYTTYFYTPTLTRIHYIIRLNSKKKLRYNLEELESQLLSIGKSWQDSFREVVLRHFGEEKGNAIIQRYLNTFSVNYREDFTPQDAIRDIEHIDMLSVDHTLSMNLYRASNATARDIKFKLYRFAQTMPLSDTLPILENMGLRVMGEQAYQLTFQDGRHLWINDLSMTIARDWVFDIETVRPLFQEAFYQIWIGNAENDLLNVLILEAQLMWREISVLRAYIKYLKQVNFTYSPQYVAETLMKYPDITTLLIKLFHLYFDPALPRNPEAIHNTESSILQKIEGVTLLDEDRIFHRLFCVIKATLRTNFYQTEKQNQYKKQITFKLSPDHIPELPLPLPKYEIFVYSPTFEGVHLRMAKVARGGVRWSDRKEDFRTEILGLMKAQQVKNAVIVPAGAKGGFVPKNLPLNGTRDEIQQEAIRCYRGFIRGLLDVTDNMQGNNIISPDKTVCYDDADPYLVVAADKGTSTFSDMANAIAIDHGFWLGDAFASGGSTGYDHKKIAITARGVWVAAKRHFQSLGINIDKTTITVVGIGDLSGDVFGNGMLQSPHLKLVAAFNHQHIFLDPNPDPEKSFIERKRLFLLPRSTWADYSAECISTGGGVYARTAKNITLSPEMKKVLEVTQDRFNPNELIQAILRAPVDLIWNGGIGTFVKASTETHEQVGDRANDGLRVNADTLRTKVVAEGGNLGCTQLARIEYALKGGLINTDFIDNSAGVDCSDHEVNIKILLNSVVEAGGLTEKQRNQLLVSMSDEVAQLVLDNNYRQSLSVSLLSRLSSPLMTLYLNYMRTEEKAGKLNRELEYLPESKTILERRARDIGLTAPEISILLAYSKIILKAEILNSDLLQENGLSDYLHHAFPTPLRKKYASFILKHRLRDEMLATQLSSDIVSQMGIIFVYQIADEMGASVSTIVRAFVAANEIFHVKDMYQNIIALDYQVDMNVQLQMINELMRLVRGVVRWLLSSWPDLQNIEKTIAHFEPHVKGVYKRLSRLLLGSHKAYLETQSAELTQAGVPFELAMDIASSRSVYHALNIIQVAVTHRADVYQVAKVYFMLADRLDLLTFRDRINAYPVTHRWSLLAKAAFKSDLDYAQRELMSSVIKGANKNAAVSMDAWITSHHDLVEHWKSVLTDLRNEDVSDLSVIAVTIRELFNVVKACRPQE